MSHSTHNRSFRGQFLQARWPNQQCQNRDVEFKGQGHNMSKYGRKSTIGTLNDNGLNRTGCVVGVSTILGTDEVKRSAELMVTTGSNMDKMRRRMLTALWWSLC